jgi:adenosylcobinamide kinase/adenosylcobinamide-phosphate guanylyltransferase
MGKIILVTGAVRSGKSEWAEHLALQSQQAVTYIATAVENPDDAEWTARIQHHRDRRPDSWHFIAEPKDLARHLNTLEAEQCVLIDSLGLWVANHLEIAPEQWFILTPQLIDILSNRPLITILVAEETGWGLVPPHIMSRLFRDRLGRLIRRIGCVADDVYLLAGGHALDLKKLGHPLPNPQTPLL